MYLCVHAYTYTCICMYTEIHLHKQTCKDMHIYTLPADLANPNGFTKLIVCVCVCVCVPMYCIYGVLTSSSSDFLCLDHCCISRSDGCESPHNHDISWADEGRKCTKIHNGASSTTQEWCQKMHSCHWKNKISYGSFPGEGSFKHILHLHIFKWLLC